MKEPISEVFNCDCVEHMRQVPDKFYDLAVVDCPYGDALPNNEGNYWNRFGERFNRYKPQITPPEQEIAQNRRNVVQKVRPYNRFGGWFDRYKPTAGRQEDARPFLDSRADEENTDIGHGETQATKIHTSGGRTQKYYPAKESADGEKKYGQISWDIAPPDEYWDELFRVSKNQIIWGGNYFWLPPTRCFLVWRKLSISEKFSMAMAEYAWTSFNRNALVYEAVPQRNKWSAGFHPTEKGIELYLWTLRHFAKEGDKIFDSHMGSQNSRIAAYNLGLDYWGCEIDRQYFEKGCAHFEEICHGVKNLKNGRSIKQLSIFDEV